MSVPKGRRKDSPAEFVIVARRIEEALIDVHIHKPKRYSFYIDRLIDIAIEINAHVVEGNNWWPKNQLEAQHRMNHWKIALAKCYSLAGQIDIIEHKFKMEPISAGDLMLISKDIKKETKLLLGIIESDLRRFRTLPVFSGIVTREEFKKMLLALPVDDPNHELTNMPDFNEEDDDWTRSKYLAADLSSEAKTTYEEETDRIVRQQEGIAEDQSQAVLNTMQAKISGQSSEGKSK